MLTHLLSSLMLINCKFDWAVGENIEGNEKCGTNGQQLKYIWGDAFTDAPNCLGPNNMPYPSAQISRNFRKSNSIWGMSSRYGRTANMVIDPSITQNVLIKAHEATNSISGENQRSGRDYSTKDSCPTGPTRLCKTRYNTTAPMYGVSLTSGQPVTIVQKFPDLLQQVVYEVCESKECDVVHGECTQTYVPYLFLVIPLGPVTLTGQDYVLVESGCVCKPKVTLT
ncbi:uncharacterized protein LOC106662778 isoform X2 [Cimex lectularius]|uniref:Uncharacterized protein n=1 Tax=Cimex lectularius TaxID=79782 RepID=A0A8I6RD90_CIMLE|nr:uncharacterized protein LOC106662778 isoform X2 [Cimex lectularius]